MQAVQYKISEKNETIDIQALQNGKTIRTFVVKPISRLYSDVARLLSCLGAYNAKMSWSEAYDSDNITLNFESSHIEKIVAFVKESPLYNFEIIN